MQVQRWPDKSPTKQTCGRIRREIIFIVGLICDICRHLIDEKLYKEEHTSEVFKLQPSDSFVSFINQLLLKFNRKKNQDKFLKEFYGKTNSNWKEYFHPYGEKKIVFLMLIHLPERLIGFLKIKQDDQGQGISEVQLIVVKIQKLDQPVLKSSPVGKVLPTSHLAGSILTGMEIV